MDTKYLKGVLRYMLSAVLSLVLIAYIIYHLTSGMSADIQTTPAAFSTVESTVTARVTVLRNEVLIYSNAKGDISYLYGDGERVAKNAALADVYPYGTDESIAKRIVELDKAIRLLESSNMSDSEKRTDTESTDNLIKNHLFSILDAADKGEVSKADERSDEFLVQLNKRRIITKSTANFNKQIASLKAERSSLYASLPTKESTVYSDSVGYFYSTLDGYENILSSQNISSLTYSQYLEQSSRPAQTYTENENGTPIGKLVIDHEWYVACEISAEELHNYETGKKYSIKFPYNNDVSINMTMYRILSEVGSDTAVLIFKTDILPQNFRYLRHQTVQIVQQSYTGYRVPVSALRVENGKAGVYTLQGSKVVFKTVDPLYEYDGYVIVSEQSDPSQLGKNDFIITKGTDLYDGKIIW